ncbi:MAG: hypothetical protein C5B49_00955 [Bdellovibrio sp.]|nr:MAG: hypothetical protein C5B49_00955 [Bdellovibrio sp.]
MTKPSMADALKKNLNRRDWNFKSVTALVLFAAIILVFVLFNGYGGRFAAVGMGAAARVNSTYISMYDVGRETERLERFYAGMLGGQMGEAQRQFLQQQALETLIQTELLAQYAEKNGIYATDREVQETVMKEVPVFQEDGIFRFERYRSILEANHLTPAEFEESLRRDKKKERIRDLFQFSSSPLAIDLQTEKELDQTALQFQYAKFDKDEGKMGVHLSDAEVREKLKDPEFKKKVEGDFKMNSSTYDQPEQVHAQHILIKAEKGNASSESGALKKIQEIKEKSGKMDFGKLAAQYTEDVGSKANKGDLGSFGRGRMVPEFETVAFAQAVGTISDPVKSPFGYHLIKVLEHQPERKADLQDFELKIAKKLIAEEKFETEVKKLEEALSQNKLAEVDEILKANSVAWRDSGPVALSAEQVPALGSPVLSQAAFELSSQRPMSKLIRDGSSRVLIRWKGLSPKKDAPAKTEDSMELARERGMDRMNAWLEDLRQKAHIERNLTGPKDNSLMD